MTGAVGSKVGQRRGIGRRGLQVTGLGLGTAPLGGLYRDLSDEERMRPSPPRGTSACATSTPRRTTATRRPSTDWATALRRYPRDQYVLSTKAGRRFVPRTTPVRRQRRLAKPAAVRSDLRLHARRHPAFVRRQSAAARHRRDRHPADSRHRTHHAWRQKPALLEATDEGGGFRALDELRSAGAVKAVGLGVNEGAAILDAMAEFDIDCALLAGRYTLLEQATLDDLLPACEARGVSILLGGAFNSGILRAVCRAI